MHSALKLPSTEVEAEEHEVEEEEADGLDLQKTEPITIMNTQIESEHSHNSQGQRGRGKRWTNKSNVQCNYCKKYGNYEQECRKKQVDQKNNQNNSRANVSKEEENLSEVMFLSYQAIEEHCSSDLWLLDSGCSNHMTGNKSLSLVWILLLS